MGWWNSNPEGVSLLTEDTDHYWGDGPADILDDALAKIVEEFKEAVGRPPKLSELLAGLKFSSSTLELSD